MSISQLPIELLHMVIDLKNGRQVSKGLCNLFEHMFKQKCRKQCKHILSQIATIDKKIDENCYRGCDVNGIRSCPCSNDDICVHFKYCHCLCSYSYSQCLDILKPCSYRFDIMQILSDLKLQYEHLQLIAHD